MYLSNIDNKLLIINKKDRKLFVFYPMNFKPITEIIIKKIKKNRLKLFDSLKSHMFINDPPAAPIPVQIEYPIDMGMVCNDKYKKVKLKINDIIMAKRASLFL